MDIDIGKVAQITQFAQKSHTFFGFTLRFIRQAVWKRLPTLAQRTRFFQTDIDGQRQAALNMQLIHAAVGNFHAVFHDDDAVGVAVKLGQCVGAEQYGRTASIQFAHDFVKHLAWSRVKACGRFVKQ